MSHRPRWSRFGEGHANLDVMPDKYLHARVAFLETALKQWQDESISGHRAVEQYCASFFEDFGSGSLKRFARDLKAPRD